MTGVDQAIRDFAAECQHGDGTHVADAVRRLLDAGGGMGSLHSAQVRVAAAQVLRDLDPATGRTLAEEARRILDQLGHLPGVRLATRLAQAEIVVPASPDGRAMLVLADVDPAAARRMADQLPEGWTEAPRQAVRSRVDGRSPWRPLAGTPLLLDVVALAGTDVLHQIHAEVGETDPLASLVAAERLGSLPLLARSLMAAGKDVTEDRRSGHPGLPPISRGVAGGLRDPDDVALAAATLREGYQATSDALLLHAAAALLDRADDRQDRSGNHALESSRTRSALHRLTGDREALRAAVEAARRAVRLCPDDAEAQAERLHNLSLRLAESAELTGDRTQFRRAADTAQQAVDLTPDAHPNKPAMLNNYAERLAELAAFTGDRTDYQKAAATARLAVDLTPNGHAAQARHRTTLAMLLMLLAGRAQEPLPDLDEALDAATTASIEDSLTTNAACELLTAMSSVVSVHDVTRHADRFSNLTRRLIRRLIEQHPRADDRVLAALGPGVGILHALGDTTAVFTLLQGWPQYHADTADDVVYLLFDGADRGTLAVTAQAVVSADGLTRSAVEDLHDDVVAALTTGPSSSDYDRALARLRELAEGLPAVLARQAGFIVCEAPLAQLPLHRVSTTNPSPHESEPIFITPAWPGATHPIDRSLALATRWDTPTWQPKNPDPDIDVGNRLIRSARASGAPKALAHLRRTSSTIADQHLDGLLLSDPEGDPS